VLDLAGALVDLSDACIAVVAPVHVRGGFDCACQGRIRLRMSGEDSTAHVRGGFDCTCQGRIRLHMSGEDSTARMAEEKH
jgi:hypothetical protein